MTAKSSISIPLNRFARLFLLLTLLGLSSGIAEADPRLAGRDDFFDAFPYANPNMNDLYERWKRGEAKLPHWIGPKDPEPQPLD